MVLHNQYCIVGGVHSVWKRFISVSIFDVCLLEYGFCQTFYKEKLFLHHYRSSLALPWTSFIIVYCTNILIFCTVFSFHSLADWCVYYVQFMFVCVVYDYVPVMVLQARFSLDLPLTILAHMTIGSTWRDQKKTSPLKYRNPTWYLLFHFFMFWAPKKMMPWNFSIKDHNLDEFVKKSCKGIDYMTQFCIGWVILCKRGLGMQYAHMSRSERDVNFSTLLMFDPRFPSKPNRNNLLGMEADISTG